MNKFILQLSLNNHQLENYVNALKKVKANYSFFSIYSGDTMVGNLPEDFINNDYIALAGIKALNISKQLVVESFESPEIYAASKSTYETAFFYKNSKNFDQQYFSNLNLPMLNSNPMIIDLRDNLDRKFDKDVFIKPTSDLKGYVGGIIKAGTTIGEFLMTCQRMPHWLSEPTLVADIKDIHSEYRFFVLGDEVITGSRYILDKSVNPSTDIPSVIMEMAHVLAKAYSPDRVFTMDLALLKNGDVEIVEYNCFNGSGTYYAPLEELILRLINLKISP